MLLIPYLARISQTYLGDLSNAANESGPWRRLGDLETVRNGIDLVTSHVWTAPVLQGKLLDCHLGRVRSCVRPVDAVL